MVTADQARRRRVGGGQRADPAICVDDLVAAETQARQQGPQAVEEIVDLRILAAHLVGIVGRDVGRADQRPAQIVEHEANAPVVGLEIDHPTVEGAHQLLMVQQNVRALGAADHGGGHAQGRVHAVDPRAGRIDDDGRAGAEGPAVGCREGEQAALGRGKRRVVGGRGAWARRQPVLHQFEHQPLGAADLGVVVGARRDDRGGKDRHLLQSAASADQPVARHHPAARSVEVVERQADLDEQDAAAAGRAGRAGQGAQGRADATQTTRRSGSASAAGATQCGAFFKSRLRSRVDWATSRNSPVSRYFRPPWMRREGAALVPEPKSALSTIRQRTPCSHRSRNRPAPLMPAPMMRTSTSIGCTALMPGAGQPLDFRPERGQRGGGPTEQAIALLIGGAAGGVRGVSGVEAGEVARVVLRAKRRGRRRRRRRVPHPRPRPLPSR